jgi:hypothetical protein
MVGTYWTRCRGVWGGLTAIAGIALLGGPAPGAGENQQVERQPPTHMSSVVAFLPPYFPFTAPPRPRVPPNQGTPSPPPFTPPALPPNPPPPKPPVDDDDTPTGGGGPVSPPQVPEPSAIITAILGTGLVGLYGIYKRKRLC